MEFSAPTFLSFMVTSTEHGLNRGLSFSLQFACVRSL